MHVANFLDVTFDLNNGKFKPYRKPNDDPLYINRHSNYPPSIIKQLPTSINKRISALSADEQTFHESAPISQNALRHSNFDHKLDYTKQAPQKNTRRNRQRNIIWFNPRGGVVTIPARTAVRGGLLHIVVFSACTVIVRLAFAEFTTRGGRKTKEKYGEFSLYSWQKASVLNGNELLFVHCVSNNL